MLKTKRPWLWIVGTAVVVIALAGGLLVWAFVVRSMSDPGSVAGLGIRIDGNKVTVKAAQCPGDRPLRVEVRDSASEKLVWHAAGPLTDQGKNGQLTLWKAEDYREAAAGHAPAQLPGELDVLVDYGSVGGTGEVFDMSAVKAARIPDGSYWTSAGLKTAKEMDAVLDCSGHRPAAS
ncbi:hypothetical protein ACFW6S_23525 [Streptomyces sp. NPDC058740]|uniref:hypothetical protein n=1 Tax=unclassified Streptomyces TaxID=2593676 RepID=UPI0036770763